MAQDWKSALQGLNLPQESEPSQEMPAETARPPKHPALEIVYERKGRGGKEATIIAGFEVEDAELKAIASKLKSKLGTGGSARGGEILIQGDRRRAVAEELRSMGFKVKGNF